MSNTIQEHIELLKKVLPGGVAFQLTQTMLNKSIIDANKNIRDFLSDNQIFDFEDLAKGATEYINCQLFYEGSLFERKISLVRPQAKAERPGDPRIWIYNLNKNADANEWVYLASKNEILYVIPIKASEKFTLQIESVFGEQLNYVVSSGLKNLIGKQLITDEFVAIFELVKNSFDAYATSVKITFRGMGTPNSKIIIADDGKGMSYDELKNKWLFVGYSAKKDGTEDDDYRHGLGVKKIFAGAKGVGRFSCDRLGSKLKLITRKDSPNSRTEVLYTNWENFEEDPKARFEDIGVIHETLPIGEDLFNHGTRLEISDLDDKKWSRKKLLDLKLSLEKLILPESDNSLNDLKRKHFSIIIECKDEEQADRKESDYYKIVNGPIKNLIFENLGLRTASIDVQISEDGSEISTILNDKGDDIYRIVERNRYDLANIHFKLFHLNQSAKLTFSRRMGFPIMKYGHVFVYKNGFRIYPFGDFEEDNFAIDLRKSNKEYSRIGTRSLSGKIEINGDFENKMFVESTSRDAGFLKNKYYDELKKCYYDILTRFEKYVVDVVKWGNKIEINDIKSSDQNEEMINLISEITGSDSIIQLWYNTNIVDILSAKQEESASVLLNNLQKAAERTGEKNLLDDIVLAQNRLVELQAIAEQAEHIAQESRISVDEAKKALEFEQQKNKYLLSTDKNISDDVRAILHNFKIVTEKINSNIQIITDKVKNDNLSKTELLERLSIVKSSSEKAYKMSRLITKADFRSKQEKSTIEITDYIQEYILEYSSLFEDRKLRFEFFKKGEKFFRKVSQLDISIVLDNLISNSEKKGADKIRIDFEAINNRLIVLFSDNGKGLSNYFMSNAEVIFELGITDTDGSGIGLNTVRSILKENYAEIKFLGNGKVLSGASFIITFN